jgi:hypothetical protein
METSASFEARYAPSSYPTSRVASALPHSEGIAYKPLCGEIAMCLRVGRMRSIK